LRDISATVEMDMVRPGSIGGRNMTGDLVPSTQLGEAIAETAKFGSKAIEGATKFGGYLDRVLGTLPDDTVGFLGDWVCAKRMQRAAKLWAETQEILRERGVKDTIEPSPSIAVPLIEAAVSEDREGLKEIWAKLLAAAMDPSRANRVRQAFIETAKAMEPLDAVVLVAFTKISDVRADQQRFADLAGLVNVAGDEIFVSLDHLGKLGMIDRTNLTLTPFGREFLRVVQD
jgi:sugar phosphate isomerase/epimerase